MLHCIKCNSTKLHNMFRIDRYWYSQNPVAWILLPLAAIFYLLVSIRRTLYKRAWLFSCRPRVPVIIVGNITVGGTGKTPVVIELCRMLKEQGRKPCVISRGYRGSSTSWPQEVKANSDPAVVGDEPLLIKLNTECPVIAGPDRCRDVEYALERVDCDIIICDDGLQHYRIQRDVEIAITDGVRQFGNGYCLPAGPMRETRDRLKNVDIVIENGTHTRLSISRAVSKTGEVVSLDKFAGRRVHAVAGIGNPESFFRMLSEQNIDVLESPFTDHYQYSKSDIRFGDELPVLMTEKDAVKCFRLMEGNNLAKMWSVPLEMEFVESMRNDLEKSFEYLWK